MGEIFSTVNVLSVLGGLLLGAAAAYLNMCISKKQMTSSTVAEVMGVNMLRMLIDALALGAAYLAALKLELPMIATLAAVAVGLSVGGVLFLSKLTKKMRSDDQKDGGE